MSRRVGSVADPYHFDTDPDPNWTLIRIRIQAKRIHYQENLKNFIKKRSYPMFCGVILLKYHFSVHNWVKKIPVTYFLFSMVFFYPDPANFLYGSGSRELIRILRIRIRQPVYMSRIRHIPSNLFCTYRIISLLFPLLCPEDSVGQGAPEPGAGRE